MAARIILKYIEQEYNEERPLRRECIPVSLSLCYRAASLSSAQFDISIFEIGTVFCVSYWMAGLHWTPGHLSSTAVTSLTIHPTLMAASNGTNELYKRTSQQILDCIP